MTHSPPKHVLVGITKAGGEIQRLDVIYCWRQQAFKNADVFAERATNESTEKNPGSSWDSSPTPSEYQSTWTPGRGAEDKLHKQHCLEALAKFQPILTLSELDGTGTWAEVCNVLSNIKLLK